ncbi:MAG: VOC family protein [Silvanigrellales bacterium]|nr:VOC family protein [Silvanigrellales bacterium]
MHFDHVALLVRSIEKTCEKLASFQSIMGSIENFPGEGTRERYIGPEDASARLLLMQPADENGPYAKAMQRRGPGLHHLALNVLDLREFIETLAGSGWYLLPQSLRTIEQSKTAWLGRPGVGALLEIHERNPKIGAPFVSRVELPIGGRSMLVDSLRPGGERVAGFEESPDNDVWINIDGQRIGLSTLM